MSKNIAFIEGRLGEDPELRYTGNGSPVCNFSVATSESYAKNGETKESTDWHKVVVWGSMAEWAAQNLRKGSLASVVGKIKTRSWEKDGVKKYITEIVADVILEAAKKVQAEEKSPVIPHENLPF